MGWCVVKLWVCCLLSTCDVVDCVLSPKVSVCAVMEVCRSFKCPSYLLRCGCVEGKIFFFFF